MHLIQEKCDEERRKKELLCAKRRRRGKSILGEKTSNLSHRGRHEDTSTTKRSKLKISLHRTVNETGSLPLRNTKSTPISQRQVTSRKGSFGLVSRLRRAWSPLSSSDNESYTARSIHNLEPLGKSNSVGSNLQVTHHLLDVPHPAGYVTKLNKSPKSRSTSVISHGSLILN